MKATPLEFRFRYLIHLAIFLLGFTAPWDSLLHLDSIRTWQLLAAWPSRGGWASFSSATIAVLVLGSLCALLAAMLRTWATAYMGASIVQDSAMHGHRIVAAGPYRFVRNPLYLGIIFHSFALALLMQPSGAASTIILIIFFELRLIGGEEVFLTQRLGADYLAYCTRVRRLIPSLTPRLPASGLRPQWLKAFLGEIYLWGAFLSFALLGWHYNALLITQGVLVSLGVSVIIRAFMPRQKDPSLPPYA